MSPFLPSLLDRLLDTPPSALTDALRRDLTNLLNTRQEALTDLPPGCPEVSSSVYTYGLPDLTAFNPDNTHECARVQRALEQAMATHEPRLASVRVLPPTRGPEHLLRFPVEATLRAARTTERIHFTTVLHLPTHTYDIQGQD